MSRKRLPDCTGTGQSTTRNSNDDWGVKKPCSNDHFKKIYFKWVIKSEYSKFFGDGVILQIETKTGVKLTFKHGYNTRLEENMCLLYGTSSSIKIALCKMRNIILKLSPAAYISKSIKFKLCKRAAFMLTGPDKSTKTQLENKYKISIELNSDSQSGEEINVYLCGNWEGVKCVRDLAIDNNSKLPDQVFSDNYRNTNINSTYNVQGSTLNPTLKSAFQSAQSRMPISNKPPANQNINMQSQHSQSHPFGSRAPTNFKYSSVNNSNNQNPIKVPRLLGPGTFHNSQTNNFLRYNCSSPRKLLHNMQNKSAFFLGAHRFPQNHLNFQSQHSKNTKINVLPNSPNKTQIHSPHKSSASVPSTEKSINHQTKPTKTKPSPQKTSNLNSGKCSTASTIKTSTKSPTKKDTGLDSDTPTKINKTYAELTDGTTKKRVAHKPSHVTLQKSIENTPKISDQPSIISRLNSNKDTKSIDSVSKSKESSGIRDTNIDTPIAINSIIGTLANKASKISGDIDKVCDKDEKDSKHPNKVAELQDQHPRNNAKDVDKKESFETNDDIIYEKKETPSNDGGLKSNVIEKGDTSSEAPPVHTPTIPVTRLRCDAGVMPPHRPYVDYSSQMLQYPPNFNPACHTRMPPGFMPIHRMPPPHRMPQPLRMHQLQMPPGGMPSLSMSQSILMQQHMHHPTSSIGPPNTPLREQQQLCPSVNMPPPPLNQPKDINNRMMAPQHIPTCSDNVHPMLVNACDSTHCHGSVVKYSQANTMPPANAQQLSNENMYNSFWNDSPRKKGDMISATMNSDSMKFCSQSQANQHTLAPPAASLFQSNSKNRIDDIYKPQTLTSMIKMKIKESENQTVEDDYSHSIFYREMHGIIPQRWNKFRINFSKISE